MSWSRVARRVRVPVGFAFAAFYLWLAQPSWISILAGGSVACGGVLLRAIASGHISKDAELTTSGPYAHTRNPLYLGSLLLATGFVVAARSWWVLAAVAFLFIAIYLPVIRSEEAFLRARFPEFEDYAQRVPRLLPRLRRSQAAPGTFSRERYLRHREYNAVLGTAAMIAALAAKLWWAGR